MKNLRSILCPFLSQELKSLSKSEVIIVMMRLPLFQFPRNTKLDTQLFYFPSQH